MTAKGRIRVKLSLAMMLLTAGGAVHAELGRDVHIQASGEVRIEVDRQALDEFGRLFRLDYPPATVMMNAVSTGMSINDILYIAVKSVPARADEFHATAESLLPVLPGWACQASSARQRYTRAVDLSQLGADPTIRELAQLYVEDNRRVVPFPDWQAGRVHLEARVTELAGLVSEDRWYVPGQDADRPVFVSIYRHSGEIVVDSGAERIRRARDQGVERLPVVLVYNDVTQRPLGGFDPDPNLGGLAQAFYDEGLSLTAVPDWQAGDHHLLASIEELEELVEIPARADIPAPRWDQAAQRIRDSGGRLAAPLLITLVRSGGGRAWVDRPVELAVAADMDVEALPVVLFYHRLDRRPCGQPASCEALLCAAASAAGVTPAGCSPASAGAAAQRARGPVPNLSAAAMPRYQGLASTQRICSES